VTCLQFNVSVLA